MRFDACHYRQVSHLLPALVSSGHHLLSTASPGRATEQAESALADVYSLAAFTADKLGDFGLSWVLADRARQHAQASGNPLSLAVATREAAVAMRRSGHHGALPTATGSDLAGRGGLLLTAAYTRAQQGHAAAIELADEAAEVAARLPADWSGNAVFAPSQVPIYPISVHVLGDHARAPTVARGIPLGSLPSAERRARVCVDVARAWYGYGDAERCLRALEHAERHAPEEVRQPRIRALTRDLLERPDIAPSGLRAFASRIGG